MLNVAQLSNLAGGGLLHLPNHNRNDTSTKTTNKNSLVSKSRTCSNNLIRVSKTEPNSKSSSSTSLSAANNTHPSPGTPSRIPVYSFNAIRSRLNSLDTLKHNHLLNNRTKHSLSAHTLSDLPEDIKLLHMVHCHCNHNLQNMPRSKTHDFTNGGNASRASTTPGSSTPKGRKTSNASSAATGATNGRLSKATNCSSASTTTNTRTNNNTTSNRSYEEYLPLCEMQKGLEKGEIVEGILRINPKNYNDAYISAPEEGLDIFIGGLYDRNRALNGDVVAVKLYDVDKWTMSASFLNAKWDEWKGDFEKLFAEEQLSAEKASESITQATLLKLLVSADLRKVNLASKALKSVSEDALESEDKSPVLTKEFPNVPLTVYRYDLAILDSRLPFSGKFIQKTGKVVGIIDANHSRVVGGTVSLQGGNKAKLLSSDSRVPHVVLPFASLPRDFVNNYEQLKENLFLVEITEWKEGNLFPKGRILQTLGAVGDLDSEIEILLRANDIDTSDFAEEALAEYDLFSEEGWKIPEEELGLRRDFRQNCVFTIDPQSARDLDDAISLVKLSTGSTQEESVYEVGVHIADVSYFIKEQTLLDNIAKDRATSVYLPNKVIPMLPHLFCQQLCSLNAGEDKLTFSVVFKMTGDGKLLEGEVPWIGRTVINSCAKLSYEHAQKMIEAKEEEIYNSQEGEFPPIFGDWPLSLIAGQVKILNGIAQAIRKRRFETGSLRLDKTKIGFLLDSETGLPISFSKVVTKDSNRLIEELMLLANKAVAERLYDVFAPTGRAFLRGHPPPNTYSMNEFAAFCATTGFTGFDTSSSGAIHASLAKLNNAESVGYSSEVNFRLFSLNLIKSMKLAVYQTVSDRDKAASFHHYALNFAKYTHFTSPIRRYADVIVHRLLCESQGYGPDSACTVDAPGLSRIANNCNARKQAAFIVSEKSNEIYLKKYIASIDSLATKAVVAAVHDHSFDVLILQFDVVGRVYLDRLPLESFDLLKDDRSDARLLVKWTPLKSVTSPEEEELTGEALQQTISSLMQIDVQMSVDKKFNFHILIAHPNGDFISVAPNVKKDGNSKKQPSSESESSANGETVAVEEAVLQQAA